VVIPTQGEPEFHPGFGVGQVDPERPFHLPDAVPDAAAVQAEFGRSAVPAAVVGEPGPQRRQRVFTARTPKVATAGGLISGTYCLVYGIAGALIGTAAKALYPALASSQDAFPVIVENLVAKFRGESRAEDAEADVSRNRLTTLLLGILAIEIAMAVTDVLNALTIAYNVLVGGLAVAIVAVGVWMWIDGIAANSPIY
jgi:hypothetical protein